MTAELPVNTALSTEIPGLQIAWDSTSLGAFITCPRYYQYTILQGWAPRELSVHLAFGQFYHSALEHYDHAKFAGADHEEAVDAAVQKALGDTWDSKRKAPWNSDHRNKNRFTLLRTVVWYLEQFREDPVKTVRLQNGKPAVELSFRFETEYKAKEGVPFLYCGHLDRVGELNDHFYVLDRKTTAHTIDDRFFAGFNPDNQFSGYLFGSRVAFDLDTKGLIVDGAQVAITFSRFERRQINISEASLEEWYIDMGYWLGLAKGFAEHQYWPMNRKSCGNYGGCQFREICSKSPLVREQWLKAGFYRRVWDPLKIRGDI